MISYSIKGREILCSKYLHWSRLIYIIYHASYRLLLYVTIFIFMQQHSKQTSLPEGNQCHVIVFHKISQSIQIALNFICISEQNYEYTQTFNIPLLRIHASGIPSPDWSKENDWWEEGCASGCLDYQSSLVPPIHPGHCQKLPVLY